MSTIPKLRILSILVVAAALLLSMAVPVLAQPVTSPLSGALTIDGANAPIGTTVDVFVGTETTARETVTTTTVGYYEVVVFGTASDEDKALSFKVNDQWATSTPSSPTFKSYEPQVVDLALVTAVYYTLAVTINPSGTGTVNKNPDLAQYLAGTVVTLTANPSSGYGFKNWSGDASGANPTTTVTMNANKSVTANFEQVFTLTVTINPSGKGTVAKNPDLAGYTPGTVVSLTANPTSGYRFKNWSGDASGTNPTTTVTMDANKSVTANFEPVYTLTVTISPSGKGTVAKNPNLSEYTPGTVVTLTATAISGYRFKNWSGADNNAINPTTVTMDANKSVTANFEKVQSFAWWLYEHFVKCL